MNIKNLKVMMLLGGLFFLVTACSKGQMGDWNLVWSDEFEVDGLPDAEKWSYDIGDGCPNLCGWGNNELEYYTENNLENARIENGHLIIEAHKKQMNNSAYTSARLVSKSKGDWKYGKLEIRAKLPSGRGTWPAIWMLSTDWEYGGWPESGEIDIMEHVGFNRDTVFGTVHTKAYHHSIGTHKNGGIAKPDFEEKFHTFAIEWGEEKIDFFVDEEKYFTFENEHQTFNEWPFDKKFHLIMNLAVGGNWGGEKGIDDSIWPQRMEVDYVRVYQKEEFAKAQSGK